jgi:hypothetical protein
MVLPERDLNLDSRDFVDFDGSSNGVSTDFTERDATDLSLFDEFSERIDCVFDGGPVVNASALVEIKLFVACKNLQAIIHCPPNALWRPIGGPIWAQSTLDTQNHPLCIFGILGEVMTEQMKRVGIWSTIVFSTTVS